MNQFFGGALAMAYWLTGLFFLRFWRMSRDSLFMFFWLAFWTFAVERTCAVLVIGTSETRHFIFLIRLIAFLLIIAGIIHKNRAGPCA